MSKFYIGVDPDLKQCGIAYWFKFEKNQLRLELMTVPQLLRQLQAYKELSSDFEVIIEAGWLNKKSNFRSTQNKAIGERIAKNVGENHAAGKIIEHACQELGITYKLHKPTTTKVNSAYFEKLTGLKTKNQELIDAGMLVYGM